jgi:hypothetical protein
MKEFLEIFNAQPYYLKALLVFWAFCLTAFTLAYPVALYTNAKEFFSSKKKPTKF